MFTFKPPSVEKNTLYVMFRRAKRHVVMVRLQTLSRWLPKHIGFARRYARESCYGFRVISEVTWSIKAYIVSIVIIISKGGCIFEIPPQIRREYVHPVRIIFKRNTCSDKRKNWTKINFEVLKLASVYITALLQIEMFLKMLYYRTSPCCWVL